jgi:hypothetical protein
VYLQQEKEHAIFTLGDQMASHGIEKISSFTNWVYTNDMTQISWQQAEDDPQKDTPR